MKINSIQLAQLIIYCHKQKPFFTQDETEENEENELFSLISHEDVEGLSYWLFFHSFIKHKIEKIFNDKTCSIKNPSYDVQEQVSNILLAFMKEQKSKKTLAKFASSDFSATGYLDLDSEIRVLSSKLNGEQKIVNQSIFPFLNSKNRRNQDLMRSLNLVLISCPDYASDSTVRKLAKNIAGLAKGERKQFYYYHLAEEHAIGFDVERDKNGQYNIFCFESAADPRHLETVDLLYKSLSQMGVSFKFKSCRSQLQRDGYNCSIYVLAALTEFAKYEQVFEYISEDYEEDMELGKLKETVMPGAMMKAGRRISLDVMDKISWVPLSALPTKIILMSQSYESMKEALKTSKDFDLDEDIFIERHKKKYRYDSAHHSSTKYINQRRSSIRQSLQFHGKRLTEKAYQEYVKDLPLLPMIDNGTELDFKKEITNNDTMSLDEKIDYIERLFLSITKRAELTKYVWKNPLQYITPTQFKSLLLLRNEYLFLISQKPQNEMASYFKNKDESILAYRLERWSTQQPGLNNIEPLQNLFKRHFSRDFVVNYYQNSHGMEFEDLKIKNPLFPLLNDSESINAKVLLDTLNALENEYRNAEGKTLYNLEKKLSLIEEVFNKIENENKKMDFILASDTLDNMTLLQSIESTEAYVLTADKRFYYMNKKAKEPLVEIPLDEHQVEKMIAAYAKTSEEADEGSPQFPSAEEKIKCLIKDIPLHLLDAITSITHHNPYTEAEIKRIYTNEALKEAYLQLWRQLFDIDIDLSLRKLRYKKELFALEIPKMMEGQTNPFKSLVNQLVSEDILIYCRIQLKEELPQTFLEAMSHHSFMVKSLRSAESIGRKLKDIEENILCPQDVPFSLTEKMDYLHILSEQVLSKQLQKEEEYFYLEQIANAYLILLNDDENNGHWMVSSEHISAEFMLLPLLGADKQKALTVANILERLNYSTQLLVKLQLLDIAFNMIVNSEGLYAQEEGVEDYSSQQLSDISILQEAYIELLRKQPYDPNAKKFNNYLRDTVKDSSLMGFISPGTEEQTQQKRQSFLAQLLEGKERPLSKTSPITNDSIKNKTGTGSDKSVYLEYASNTFFKMVTSFAHMFKTEKFEDILTAYFQHIPQATSHAPMKKYQIEEHSSLNFKLKTFHFSDFMPERSRWIVYERYYPPVKSINEFDWKLNLAIHKDDLLKAFLIIADCARSFKLGTFKLMSQKQANCIQSEKDLKMLGREAVIYCNANPELDSKQWVKIISVIEDRLKQAGIRPSTDVSPASNRKLGKYTSYTHGAWTVKRMDVPFDEGIRETALEDEDLFDAYQYDEATESIILKEQKILASFP
ncbi:hypothetical protein FOG18_02805 [Legionella israelensis]|uniref:YopJ family acetyltransferase n=1 Tax=Legionella israelensis TaxID=454 RepID=UPI00118135A0|nr:hypothetical protein [Legionella israelensis]QDP71580.1 hypothetical protein FOG18_02805 [Legionella israelensis]